MLIIIDYIDKFNTDLFQRKFYVWILASTFIAILSDFLYISVAGRPGKFGHYFLYFINTLYFIFQNLAYYLVVVFIDYLAYKNMARTKKFFFLTGVILSVNMILLILNLPFGFYFYISADNLFVRGDKYYLRLIISYLVIVFASGDLIISSKFLKRSQIYLIIFFSLLSGLGAALDLILNSGNLIWPCLSAAFLYLYFFIIRADSNLDNLTGIGNRFSFNQFIDKLSRQNTKQSYSIIMIDMDEFKKINDTYGHLEGDHALQDMAVIIKGCIRHTDFAARYGGDEFVLAIKAEHNAEALLARLQTAIGAHNNKNIRPYKIQISYGWDVFTTNSGQSVEKFLAHIDSLMYRYKAEQRRRTDQAS
ncbi:MAG: GGDEF domain-containing protein [Treponema sp.]|nr:GGDEF domain-containing protein [Treponema sp.]